MQYMIPKSLFYNANSQFIRILVIGSPLVAIMLVCHAVFLNIKRKVMWNVQIPHQTHIKTLDLESTPGGRLSFEALAASIKYSDTP